MGSKPTVLLVDDDKLVTMLYLNALKEDFNVEQFSNPDAAFSFVKKRGSGIAAIILDIMMIPGERYESQDTEQGLKTGVFMYKDFRILYKDKPIIILTNVS